MKLPVLAALARIEMTEAEFASNPLPQFGMSPDAVALRSGS
jgi:hypothetical protein